MLAALWASRVNLAVVYYGFKCRSLYAHRGEPRDEARVNPLSHKLNTVCMCMHDDDIQYLVTMPYHTEMFLVVQLGVPAPLTL